MARRTHLTAASLLLLGPVIVGCATTAPPSPAHAPDQPVYLEGVTSEYSVRLDQFQPQDASSTQRMPAAVVAKDKRSGAMVVASLHRVGPNYALDLIVHNLGTEPVELPRARVRLYDQLGTQLKQVEDWPGAENVGLRASLNSQGRQQEQEFVDDLHLASVLDSEGATSAGPAGNPLKGGAGDTGQQTASSSPNFNGPSLTRVSADRGQVKAPEMLRVEPDASQPFWVYWSTEGRALTMPLTAVVQLGDRGLLFRFDAPAVR